MMAAVTPELAARILDAALGLAPAKPEPLIVDCVTVQFDDGRVVAVPVKAVEIPAGQSFVLRWQPP